MLTKKKIIFLLTITILVLMFTLSASGLGYIQTGTTNYHSVDSDYHYPAGWYSRTSTEYLIADFEYVFDYGWFYDTVTTDIWEGKVLFGTQVKVKSDMQIYDEGGVTLSKTMDYTAAGSDYLDGRTGKKTIWTKTTLTNDWAYSSIYMYGD